MVKVRMLIGAATALPLLAGCSQAAQDDVAVSDDHLNEVAAGAGEISVHGYQAQYRSTTGGDEFIRVDERLKGSLPFDLAVDAAAAHDVELAKSLRADPSLLEVVPRVTFVRADGTSYDVRLAKLAWQADAMNGTFATSAEVVVPKGVKRLTLDYEATALHGGVPQKTMVLGAHSILADFAVFGAFGPNKVALLDTLGAQRRTRVVEGGGVVPGAHVTIDVTDWRLDTVVDKGSLDLHVGKKQSGNRFGPAVVDADGALEYEVSGVVSFDDGATYQPINLAKGSSFEIFGNDPRRFLHAVALDVPANAEGNMKLALHVKAFVVMPKDGIIDPRYAPGERVLLRDVWDNNGGTDYSVPIASAIR